MRPIKIVTLMAFFVTLVGLLVWVLAPKAGAGALQSKGTSADGIWETQETRPNKGTLAGSISILRLNKDALAQHLARAPMEGSADLRQSRLILFLPAPDGSMQRFQVEESPIMEASLAARLPGVKTYRGRGIDDATISARFDLTPQGLHALVLSAQGSTYIEPASSGDTTNYVTHTGPTLPDEVFKCGVTAADEADAAARGVYSQSGKFGINAVTNGSTLRTYRLAIATTGEWFGLYGGGNVANAQTAITSIINLVDAIYEREVAIRFTLVNNTSVIFTNAGTDPYSTNAADNTTLGENQTTLDNLIGSANYDVGHVFGGITGLGAGSTSFSGLAGVGVTCSAGSKGRGVSTMGNNPASPTTGIFISGIAHEIGHEFSATHTFNATIGGCSGQRDGTSAYEVGGGSTLMSYQICGSENLQSQSDSYFHVRSLEQIVNYATSSSCASPGVTGNNAPIVTGPGNFTIPANTPFQLTASASDTNGSLTYSWEEYDLGAGSPPDTDDGSRPIFRGYKPVTVPTRYFPSLAYILNNANVPPATTGSFLTGESLPTTSRTMNFQLVVRDNQSNGGAISTATSVLTVVNAAGPFVVTAPNGGENWSGVHNVTWNVANTSGAPISAANVKITLSTDGGQSFPYTLAASVPNVGAASITLPNGIVSSTCRIKVEAIGNIFFDISNANFSLSPADTCPAIGDISPKAGAAGNFVVITGINFLGANAVIFSNNVPAAGFTVINDTTIKATVPAGASGGPITVSKNGCNGVESNSYSFCTGGPVTLNIDDGFDETASEVSSNGAYYVNRLTPASYPATLTQVAIFWDSSFTTFPPGTAINVVAGNNSGGTTNINGTSFQSFGATAGSSGFTTYTLSNPVTITSGDFVVGFQVPVWPPGTFPVAVDSTSPVSRSYFSGNGTTFSNVTDGNYMIRAAEVFTGCSAGLPTLKILSIAKPANGHFIVQCLGLPNVVNNLQAAGNPSPASFVTLSPPPPTADNAGAFQYDDAAAGLTRRFYRVVYP